MNGKEVELKPTANTCNLWEIINKFPTSLCPSDWLGECECVCVWLLRKFSSVWCVLMVCLATEKSLVIIIRWSSHVSTAKEICFQTWENQLDETVETKYHWIVIWFEILLVQYLEVIIDFWFKFLLAL